MKAESIQVCFDTFYLKVIPKVKINPKMFSNPDFFFKEESMALSPLTLPHQHQEKNNLKTQHEKENLHSL